jgi:hypothetical protein
MGLTMMVTAAGCGSAGYYGDMTFIVNQDGSVYQPWGKDAWDRCRHEGV